MPQPKPVNRRKRFFIELSRTQLLITVVASLFILSWVFILGIIVGRGIVADTITQALKSQISKLQLEKKALMDKYLVSDQKPGESQGEILKPQLDFYDHLGKKEQEHVVMTTPKPTPPPEGAVSTIQVPVDKKPEKTGPAPEATARASETAPSGIPAPSSRPELKAPPPPVTARASVPGKSVIPSPPDKEKKSAASPADEPAGAVFLQAGSYREEGTAHSVVQRLSAKGYQALVSGKDIPEKGGKWYRVRLGPLKTRQEADTLQKKLQQEGFQTIVIGK